METVMKDLLNMQFAVSIGELRRTESSEILYSVELPPHRSEYVISAEGELATEEYFVLEYSTLGWARPKIYRQPCAMLEDEEGNIYPLACYDDLISDGKRYTVAVKTDGKRYKRIKFVFKHGKCPYIRFNIHKLYCCRASELPVYCEGGLGEARRELTVIDISALYNRRLDTESQEVRLGGGRFFDTERVTLYGIPFSVRTSGENSVAPPPPPTENDDIIDNFGVKARRRVCRPVSRDGETSVELSGRRISEILFITAIEGKRYQRVGFASGATILGTYGTEVTAPLHISDVEGFAVETVYRDGRHDISLPYNVSAKRYGMMGDLSVYAVATDGSEVERVIFRNRSLDTDLSLVALTVNETEERLFPELMPRTNLERICHSVSRERDIVLDGDRLSIRSGALRMTLDLSRGLFLEKIENDFTPVLNFTPDSLIKMRRGGIVTPELAVDSVKVSTESAAVSLVGEGLSFDVIISIGEKNAISWGLSVKNVTREATKRGIIFPYLSGIEYLDRDDGWYFLPKYQNINSNGTVYVCEESSPSYPMQFMDVYSAGEQGGLALTTKERELVVRKYALEKRDDIKLYVEYPEMYGEILPGAEFSASETVLTAHSGDWRESFRIYKSWLDGWYEPYFCQDKKWYRESFWLLAEITDFFETEEMCRFPIWYDKETDHFNYLDILDEQKKISGYYPDILHMWAWSNRIKSDGKFAQKWGNFGESEYADYGGLENFRSAIHEFMEKRGVYSSLYLHPTLLSDFYPQFEKYKHLMVEGAAGNNITIFGDSHRMCHASEEWRDHALAMYSRVYSELKPPILYVDEFSLRIGNRCFAKHHGHEVPSNLLKTDREFISRLKDIMPHEVVLYGEYAAVDVNARYIDCNISYSIIDTVVDMIESSWSAGDGDGKYSRVITDAYRFAFPKIVQLVLPMAMRNLSWHPEKFIFWNGEAIYDSLWDIEESRGHEFVCRAYGIKKKYADCFSSDTPEMMVDTETPAVVANKFLGNERTVYTLYNRAYTTYRGTVLRIPHVTGAEYYDAWEGEPITPVIKDGYAEISLTVHAQSIGCVAVTYNKG